MKTQRNENVHYEIFDSFYEFVNFASANNAPQSSNKQFEMDFHESHSLKEATDWAHRGYSEIRPKVNSIVETMEERLSERFGERYVTDYSISGSSVDMGKFVTGEPECMLEWHTEPAASIGRVVKVVVAGTASSGISKDWIIARGTAVVALIDTLHKLGLGVELWWDSSIEGKRSKDGFTKYSTLVRLHDSSEPLDIDNIMWAIAHPDMLRRLAFSVQEQSKYQKEQGAVTFSGYGTPTELTSPKIMDFDVTVERLQSGRGDIVNNPLGWVITTVQGLGFTE